ncbi:phosphotransferase enzyme family protein [Promicromonospora sukumoe]|uniref:phosphotransferase enzyme family protein n=1 Tax=Promicromonospora sukumoe TaxID=88382 RepID=UPI0037CC4413
MPGNEEPLTGGNMSEVVRVGDTVRRSAGPWTPTVHAYLRHVRARGVTEVPEPIGLDERGREIVSFLPGDVPGWPAPEWLWSEENLRDAGRLLRRLHDASLGLAPPGAVWQLPAREPAEVICHNDAAPYNMVFRSGRLVGLIDVDTASPGPRLWDLAYTAYRMAPFASDAFAGVSYDVGHLDPPARLDALVAAYGAVHGAAWSRADVLGTMVRRLTELAAFSEARADDGGPAELREHAAMYRSDAARVDGLASDATRPAGGTSI